MHFHILLAFLRIDCSRTRDLGQPRSLTDAYPFYHSSERLVDEARALQAGGCIGLHVYFEKDGALSVPVARVTGGTLLKAMIVFGVHGRELVSAETGLGFLRRLCSAEGASLREQSTFVIVLNANPGGRRKVEEGEWCFRTNANGVDINRNYGNHWEAKRIDTISGPKSHGSKPFSEPETRIIAKLLQQSKPHLFVDVHSGDNSLLAPYSWTWNTYPDEYRRKLLNEVSKQVTEEHCPVCAVGAAAHTLGYSAPGTSVDYADSVGVRFPYIWEVYDSTQSITSLANSSSQTTHAIRNCTDQGGPSRAVASFLSRQPSSISAALCRDPEMRAMEFRNTNAERRSCLSEFNPLTEEELVANVARWSAALLTVSNLVRVRLLAGE